MEVVGGNTLLPGDPRLIDHIVCELKSQGIFDQFRKECIADVDTKPAYQNLRQRVEGSVTGFLKTQNWRPDMNKNQLREMLRKNIYESGFLETGVERIVDQVVNPKINTVFLPQVEEVVYKFLGLAKPTRNTAYNPPNGPLSIDTADLLPTDLDPISPDTELLAKDEKPNETEETATDNLDDSKNDEFESPPFEPINEQTVYGGHDESSNDSRISGISGLTSHDSNMSDAAPDKTVPDVNNADSQLSKVSSNSRLSIVTTDSKHTPEKMDISDENSEDAAIKIEENTSLIGDKEEIRDELEEIRMEINGHMASKEAAIMEKEIKMEVIEETTEVKINEQVEDITQKAEEINIKEETTVIKEEITTIKEETPNVKEETPVVKEEAPIVKEEIKEETVVDSSKTETKKSDRHRHDSEKRKDKHSDKDRKDDKKSDKDKKDKYKSSSSSRDKDRHRDKSKDSKSSKDKDSKSRDKSRDDKNKDDKSKDDKTKSSSSSTSKHSSRDRNRSSSSKSDSKSSKDSKSKDSKSSSKKSDSSKSRSRDHSKSDSSKHNSSHSSKDRKSSSSKDYRDKKDPKKSSKDDHSSSRDKKNDTRRSADRDSNDGSSNLNNTNTTSTTSSKEKDSSNSSNKSKSDNSDFSGSNSGDSGQSDNIQQTVTQDVTTTTTTTLDELALNPPSPQIMKMKKPKIASNIFEVRKLMRIRKKMEKMEKKRQRQQELAAENKMRDSPQSIEDTDSVDSESLSQNTSASIDELVKNIASITGEELSDHETNTNSTAIVSKESWDAIEAKLSQSAHENVDFNLYGEDTGDSSSSTSKDDATTKRSKRLSEEEDCLYFNSEVSPTTERFLQSVEQFKINSVIETKRLRNNFWPSTDDSKIKGKKRKIDGEIDTENNNKKITAIGDDVLDTLTASPSGSNLSNGSIDVPVKPKSSRVKKTKKNTTVNCSPSSDADSEHLIETKRPSRASILKNQRYSSDDLYKPRPVVSGSSRRQRGLLNNTDKKN